MSVISHRRRLLATSALVATLGLATACTGSTAADGPVGDDASPASAADDQAAPPVQLRASVPKGRSDVPVDTLVGVKATDGTIDDVRLYSGRRSNTVDGETGADGSSWDASERLEPGTSYTLVMTGTNADGERTRRQSTFTTADLSLDQQTYADIAPLDGETVGVGMPVIVRFDIAVTDRAAIERELEITSEPAVRGSWSWVSGNEVHYRPKTYWPTGAKVTVDADINSVKAGPDLYGQESRSVSFQVGDAVESTVDVGGHEMTVRINGKVARTLPITTGKAGFETRGGKKVVMEKFDVKRMDAATTGVSEDDPEYYNIPDVQYAMRVTNSGEFLHAAPWSVGSQGAANVSHGCVGLSTSDAEWLYSVSKRGDVIDFVNSPRGLEDDNGWTMWNESFKEFKKGSAL